MGLIDLYDQATNNLEWYDPSSVTTADGSLVITFSQQQVHDLNYQGGKLRYNLYMFCTSYIYRQGSLVLGSPIRIIFY